MENKEQRIYPKGLCETCFWRYECYYAIENPNEYVRQCEDDGGLSYLIDEELNKLQQMSKIRANIARDANGVCRIFCQRAKYKHWFQLGKHAETDTAFEQALAAGSLCWGTKIVDPGKLF